jgi:CYTH domain-containing protein
VRETYAEALAAKCRDHAAELALHLSRVVSLEEREEAHQARITGKRLRYLLEPVREAVPEAASMVKRMKGLQDVLGELNDARVLDGELRSALEDAAVQHVRELHARVARSDEEGARRLSRRNPRTGLIEIARRGRERADALFSRLESRWLGRGIARVVGYAEKVARALEARARAGREVERKYLLTRMPELPEGAISSEIHQGWLPGDALQERLRRRRDEGGDAFTRTVKVGIGLVRTELEEKTTPDLFEALWPFTKGRRVTKRRWCVRQGDRTWEIDEFLDRDLVLAEIELEDSDEEVRIPEWLAPVLDGEVTGDARYVNVNLAR